MDDYNGPGFATLSLYPNPVTDPTLKIKIEGLKAGAKGI
jgi:hypothetical protein